VVLEKKHKNGQAIKQKQEDKNKYDKKKDREFSDQPKHSNYKHRIVTA